ncbi:MAG: hypothetical protein P4L85_14040 [Paludisphaera borealis]|uniref:hypothetical protein n=1 Tax=Paludisphaera borealis TaxID=1387353 RepID=UPI00284D8459|nr:hypothetical protein [Paludisphaera borealis]MDR3620467.1 hypothetical protein [Paludisphaera borealis]
MADLRTGLKTLWYAALATVGAYEINEHRDMMCDGLGELAAGAAREIVSLSHRDPGPGVVPDAPHSLIPEAPVAPDAPSMPEPEI